MGRLAADLAAITTPAFAARLLTASPAGEDGLREWGAETLEAYLGQLRRIVDLAAERGWGLLGHTG